MNLPLLPRSAALVFGISATLSIASLASAQSTGFNKNSGTNDFNSTDNWVGGAVNGIWDSSLTLTANSTATLGANTTLGHVNGISLNFSYAGAFSQTLRADGTGPYTLGLGGDILVNTASTSPNPVVLLGSFTGNQSLVLDLGGASRTFNVASSGARNISVRGNLTGATATDGIVKIGTGTVTYETGMSYTGDTLVNGGSLVLAGSGNAAGSTFVVNNGASLSINNSGNGVANRTRTGGVTLNSGNLAAVTHSGSLAAYDDQIGALTVNGSGTVTLTAPTGKHAQITASSFTQNAGGTTLFRGTNLGVNNAADKVALSSNIVFTAAPTLSGSGAAGTSTVGIIAGAYGDTTPGGTGAGLVTYDAAKGVRLLASNEYTATLADGAGNVSLAGVAGGVTGAPRTVTLDGNATIQSLSLNTSGATGNSGLVVAGTGDLQITSGTIFANQAVTGTVVASDAIVISKNLVFGNVEGKILVGSTTGVSNNTTAAPLNISGVIGGTAGVTKAGAGNLTLSGASGNTYTGTTTLNAGNLLLAKTGGAQAVTGDLVINGGVLIQNSNQIADSAAVTVNSGAWRTAPSGSGGSASSETVSSVTINGGTVTQSSSSVTSGTLTVTNALTINGGAYTQVGGYKTNVGSLGINGGTATLSAANGGTTTVLTVNGDFAITNVASSIAQNGAAYTPITLNAGSTSAGAQLVLLGDLTFTGNATNTNTATIASSVNTNLGTVQLGGARTFNIGDGAAANDLTISALLADRTTGATETGGLIKTGLGTLALSAANAYTGATTVEQGTLALIGNGALNAASALTVRAGATFDTTAQAGYAFNTTVGTTIGVGAGAAGIIEAATATFSDATLTLDFGAIENLLASYQLLDVSGSKTGHFASVTATGATFNGTFLHDTQGVWTLESGGYTLTFAESSGLLTFTGGAIPEPSAAAALAGLAAIALAVCRRKRVRASA